MLSITVIAVGKLKERYWTEACAEYSKRMTGQFKLTLNELDEYRLPQNPSDAQIAKCIKMEGDAILAKIPKRSYVFALCIEGRAFSSEELAKKIGACASHTSHLVFVIGGSYGLSDSVKKLADCKLSFSPMTFPHQLARVMLFEQLYRCGSILQSGKYHK